MKTMPYLLNRQRQDRRAGSALFLVVMLVAILSLTLGGMTTATWSRARLAEGESNRTRSLAIAEAGLTELAAQMAAGQVPADAPGTLVTNTFAGGDYSATYELLSQSGQFHTVLLTSTGTYRNQATEAALVLRFVLPETEGEPGSPPETPVAGGPNSPPPIGPLGSLAIFAGGSLEFSGGIQSNLGDYGAHCNGNLLLSGGPNLTANSLSSFGTATLSGNPQLHLDAGGGRLHANGPVSLRGTINAAEVTSSTSVALNWGMNLLGNAIAEVITYPGWFSPMPPIFEIPVTPVPSVDLPFLDFTAFETFAAENAYAYTGNQTITRDWLTADILARTGVNVNNNENLIIPDGGVMFVDGNVSFTQDMKLQGALVATGNVTIGGSCQIINPTPYPSIVTLNGNITIGGGANGPTLDGWIYAMNGSISAGGGGSGWGMIAAQNVTITAGYAIGAFQGSPLVWPGTGGDGDDGGDNGGEGGTQPTIGTPTDFELLAWVR